VTLNVYKQKTPLMGEARFWGSKVIYYHWLYY